MAAPEAAIALKFSQWNWHHGEVFVRFSCFYTIGASVLRKPFTDIMKTITPPSSWRHPLLCATLFSVLSLPSEASELTIAPGSTVAWESAAWTSGVPGADDDANLLKANGNNAFLTIAPAGVTVGNLSYTGGTNQLRIQNESTLEPSTFNVIDKISIESGYLIFTKSGSGQRFNATAGSVEVANGATFQLGRNDAGISFTAQSATIASGGTLQVGWRPIGGVQFGSLHNEGTFHLIGGGPLHSGELSVVVGQLTGTQSSSVSTTGIVNPATATMELGSQTLSVSTYHGTISNGVGTAAVAIRKSEANVQVFTAANSYTGGTWIEGGALVIENRTGSGLGSGAVTVGQGGTLGGGGYLNSTETIVVESGGMLAPGVETAFTTLHLNGESSSGTLLMESGSSFQFRLGAGGVSDQIEFLDYELGDLALQGGNIGLHLLDLQEGEYTLFSFKDDAGAAVASGLNSGLFVANGESGFDYQFVYGNDLLAADYGTISLRVAVIPEPATLTVFGLGLAALALTRGRRRA